MLTGLWLIKMIRLLIVQNPDIKINIYLRYVKYLSRKVIFLSKNNCGARNHLKQRGVTEKPMSRILYWKKWII